ncbi:hypothetical protein ZHAS_00012616 [Anopheles sinensis]|uniref:Uncharacterized protein n=1 Tax=Anopheles sinensis TaxID=74873 RepID=A0A084W3A5_ANOSI|nr:hypothetical protein ZHAS_00012616 [Anopheles sinensis]
MSALANLCIALAFATVVAISAQDVAASEDKSTDDTVVIEGFVACMVSSRTKDFNEEFTV